MDEACRVKGNVGGDKVRQQALNVLQDCLGRWERGHKLGLAQLPFELRLQKRKVTQSTWLAPVALAR